MEDISRDREEEEKNRPLEEEERRSERKKIRYETLPEMSYQKYEENIQKDMDVIFNPSFLNRDGVKFNHSKKEVKGIRRFLLDTILLQGIPRKFNSSTSYSDVFKNTTLEKDRKKSSSIIYVKYKGVTAFSYNTTRDSVGERLREVNKKVFEELKNDLEREIVEFKNGTFPGQVTQQFERQAMDLGFIDKTIARPEPTSFIPRAYQPGYKDVDDAQKEITEKMKMEFEREKYNLESSLRQERDIRRRVEDNLERTLQNNKEVLADVNRKLKEKDERIQTLESQLRTGNFSQFDRDSTNREIQELRAEISKLENQKKDLESTIRSLRRDLEKDAETINELQKQVSEKQRRIEELERKGQDKRQIDQLKKEKADLEKQLEAQKQRTKFALDSREKQKEFNVKDKADLAASEEKILSLTKEIDDLNKSIKDLKKVNSKKVKEYEDYKVEAERKLDKVKTEYIQEKAELNSAYQRDISELESAISILESEKKEGFSKNEIDSLKSSLENRDIIIQDLENQNHRLRDLNLSLKEIQEGSEEEISKREEEIKKQKERFKKSKEILEERLRKKVQELRDVEAKNKKQEEEIESYLSRLEELNKKVDQSVDKRVFQANQNEFTRVQKDNESLRRSVLDLQREKEAVEKREKILENNIKYQQERIEEKDRENTEFVEKEKKYIQEKKEFDRKEKTFQQNIRDKDEKIRQKNVTLSRQREELEDLRKKSEELVDALEKQKFYKQQYEEKDAAYKALEKSSQVEIDQGVRDKDQVEEELRQRQKEIQELLRLKDGVGPKKYEEMANDNKNLNKTIDFMEKNLRQTEKIVIQLHDEKASIEKKYKDAKDKLEYVDQQFQDYRQRVEKENRKQIDNDLNKIRKSYNNQVKKFEEQLEKQKKNYEFQLSQRLRPGDIKSVQILLNNLSLDDLNEEDYAEAQLSYKAARNNFERKANDETSSKVQRLMFEELKKLADIRLDLLNMSFNYPVRTEAGKEFLRRTDQTLAGKFYRFRMRVGRYLAGTTLGAGVMAVFYYVYELMKAAMSGSAHYAYKYGYPIATKIGKAAWNSKRSTKIGIGLTAAAYIDKSQKEGYINTLYNWLYTLYYGLEKTAEIGSKSLELGIEAAETIVKTSADTARYVANNTSTVFLMIISAIGVGVTIKYSREK